jgi:hypothetical protein
MMSLKGGIQDDGKQVVTLPLSSPSFVPPLAHPLSHKSNCAAPAIVACKQITAIKLWRLVELAVAGWVGR